MSDSRYEIKLPQFEGPFDLLLFFIERDELDIYDIPIANITNDFLEYLHQMKEMNIELASEFMLVASTLMRVKAKMLLPRKELDEEGNEIDPREELIQKLLEYKQYKEVLNQFKELESQRTDRMPRGNIIKENTFIGNANPAQGAELEYLTLYRLLKVFEKVVDRFEMENDTTIHTVQPYSFTIEGQKEFILKFVKDNTENKSFEDLFDLCKERIHAIFIFLALLELIQERKLQLTIGEGINSFWITAA